MSRIYISVTDWHFLTSVISSVIRCVFARQTLWHLPHVSSLFQSKVIERNVYYLWRHKVNIRFLSITFDWNTIETWDRRQNVRLVKTHLMIGNMTYLDQFVTLTLGQGCARLRFFGLTRRWLMWQSRWLNSDSTQHLTFVDWLNTGPTQIPNLLTWLNSDSTRLSQSWVKSDSRLTTFCLI